MFRIASWVMGAALGASAVQGAAAAELGLPPVKAPPVVVASPSWAGFYIGGQVGVGGDSFRWQNLGPSAACSPPGAVTRDRNGGVIGGGQIGYNFQAGNIV